MAKTMGKAIIRRIVSINIFIYLKLEKMKKKGRKPPNKINVEYNISIIYIYKLFC